MHDIFISYSRKDVVAADLLCDELSKEKFTFWIDRSEIPLGISYPEKIADAIENSRLLILVSSRNAAESDYVTKEVFFALNHKIIVVPFRIDNEPYNRNLQVILDIYNYYPAYPPPMQQYLHEFINKLKGMLAVDNTKPFFKRITDENDNDLSVFLTIYRSCFPEDKNVSEEFIVRNLSVFCERHQTYLFVVKTNTKVIGIADVSYFPEYKRLFVSYIGVYHYRSKGDQTIYTYNILEGLINYFENNNLEIVDVVFENQEERVFRFFGRVLKSRFHLNLFKVCIDFVQPRMMADNETGETDEVPAILAYLPLRETEMREMTKIQVLEIIRFLHKEIYNDLTDAPLKEHTAYLDTLYQRYEHELPEIVSVSDY